MRPDLVKPEAMTIALVGRGKVGTALCRAAREAALRVSLYDSRRLPAALSAELVVLAVRDGAISEVAASLRGALASPTAVVHCAGALGPGQLDVLVEQGIAVGVMHPAVSVVDARARLEGASAVLAGDEEAVAAARRLCVAIGMHPLRVADLDRALYHAALALAANGTAALAAAASDLLRAAGLDERAATALLGPLLASVAANLERVGPEDALSGPVRRGSVGTIVTHLARIGETAPRHEPLYRAIARAQLPLAKRLGEADPEDLAFLAELLE